VSFSRGTKCRGAYRYAHVMFELSFYLTKLVLTAPFQCNATSTASIHQHHTTTNPRTDTAIEEGIPSRQLFSSLTVYFDHHPLITSLPSQHLRQKGKNEERRGQGMRVEGTFFLLIFHSILLTTITGIPSSTSYSNEDTVSQVVPSSSCCFFLSTGREGFINYPSSSSYAAFPCNEEF
jgi:hypothetical protein